MPEEMTRQEAIDKLFKCFVEGTAEANRKYGFGARVERRVVGPYHEIFAVCYPDGTEDLHEVGAELSS